MDFDGQAPKRGRRNTDTPVFDGVGDFRSRDVIHSIASYLAPVDQLSLGRISRAAHEEVDMAAARYKRLDEMLANVEARFTLVFDKLHTCLGRARCSDYVDRKDKYKVQKLEQEDAKRAASAMGAPPPRAFSRVQQYALSPDDHERLQLSIALADAMTILSHVVPDEDRKLYREQLFRGHRIFDRSTLASVLDRDPDAFDAVERERISAFFNDARVVGRALELHRTFVVLAAAGSYWMQSYNPWVRRNRPNITIGEFMRTDKGDDGISPTIDETFQPWGSAFDVDGETLRGFDFGLTRSWRNMDLVEHYQEYIFDMQTSMRQLRMRDSFDWLYTLGWDRLISTPRDASPLASWNIQPLLVFPDETVVWPPLQAIMRRVRRQPALNVWF